MIFLDCSLAPTMLWSFQLIEIITNELHVSSVPVFNNNLEGDTLYL